MNVQDLPIRRITRDPEVQPRVETDDELAGEYALELQAGEKLPDPVVFDDNVSYWLADGFHTVRAHELNRQKTVRCQVIAGTRRDAILYAVGANTRHGQRRNRADMRKAVRILLGDVKDEDRSDWPNTRIAQLCRVSEFFVRTVKKELKIQDASIQSRTDEVENIHEISADLSPAEAAVLASMSREEIDQQLRESVADAMEDRIKQAEDSLNWVLRELGEGKELQDLRKLILNLRNDVSLSAGKEKRTEVLLNKELLDAIKVRLGRCNKAVAELPGGRNLQKRAEYIWERLNERAT